MFEDKKDELWLEDNTESKVVLGDYGTVPEDTQLLHEKQCNGLSEVTLFDFLRERPRQRMD